MTSMDVKLPGGDSTLRIAAGDQGNVWNNCITVGPDAPGVVAVGWQHGTFVSPNGGGVWLQVVDSPHLHSDVHMVRIVPTDSGGHDLWIGSDGGLARVDLETFFAGGTIVAQSNYNRPLPIVQCYSTYPLRQFWGTLSASTHYPTDGFIAAGVQDNGNLYCDLNRGPAPWQKLEGGDGGWVAFVEDGGLVHRNKDDAVSAATRKLPGSVIENKGVVPVEPAVPGMPPGLAAATFGEAVRRPTFRGPGGGLMEAAAAFGSTIYGMFRDAGTPTGYRWESLATLPSSLISSCVGSLTGNTVFAASGARIFAIDSKSGGVLELPVQLPKLNPSTPQTGGVILRIVPVDQHATYAVLNNTSARNHYVLRLDGLVWRVPGVVTPVNSPIFGFDAGRNREGTMLLFAATGGRVWASDDDTHTWNDISSGLPERPHCAELRLIAVRQRQAWLYPQHVRSVGLARACRCVRLTSYLPAQAAIRRRVQRLVSTPGTPVCQKVRPVGLGRTRESILCSR